MPREKKEREKPFDCELAIALWGFWVIFPLLLGKHSIKI